MLKTRKFRTMLILSIFCYFFLLCTYIRSSLLYSKALSCVYEQAKRTIGVGTHAYWAMLLCTLYNFIWVPVPYMHYILIQNMFVQLCIKSLYNRLFKLFVKVYLPSPKPFLFYVSIYNEYRMQQFEALTIFLVIGACKTSGV